MRHLVRRTHAQEAVVALSDTTTARLAVLVTAKQAAAAAAIQIFQYFFTDLTKRIGKLRVVCADTVEQAKEDEARYVQESRRMVVSSVYFILFIFVFSANYRSPYGNKGRRN